MRFYVSNMFFGNEIVAKNRHFRDANSMNMTILENWNSIITPTDEVYILGGVGEFEFLLSLNGEKILMMSECEQKFYDDYIDSVTTERDDYFNDEMFGVYIKNMFYIKETIFNRSVVRKDYSGSLIRLSTQRKLEDSTFTVIGGTDDYQRLFKNGINSSIVVNGMFPISEIDVEELKKHRKDLY